MKKIALLLMVVGLACVGYFGFQYYTSVQSVADYQSSSHKEAKELQDLNINKKSANNQVEKQKLNDEKIMSDEIDRDEGEEVATLKIPELDKQFTTYWGTGEDTLGQGVGMYVSEWTVTPENRGNVVLSGHRNTVFTGLGELDDGDTLELDYEGETYEYEIEKTWITDPDDRSVIVDKDDPTLTLTTCYPFDFVGNAPERYIVQAKLLDK